MKIWVNNNDPRPPIIVDGKPAVTQNGKWVLEDKSQSRCNCTRKIHEKKQDNTVKGE